MTLILGILSRNGIIVRADGFSKQRSDKETKVTKRDLQKVFASNEHPVALAHHGENVIRRTDIGELLQGWIDKELPKFYRDGLNATACALATAFDSDVRRTLGTSKYRDSFGIWVSGWWPCTGIHDILEIYWKKHRPDRIRLHMNSFGDFVWGGNGLKYAKATFERPSADPRFKTAYNATADDNALLMDSWYQSCLDAQAAVSEDDFGGQWTEAKITKNRAEIGKGKRGVTHSI